MTNFNIVDHVPILGGVESPKEVCSQIKKDASSQGRQISNLKVHNVSNRVSTQDHEPVAPEGFLVEGPSSQEMAKVQSVLECFEIRIVKEDQKVSISEGRDFETQDKVYARRKKKNERGSPGME